MEIYQSSVDRTNLSLADTLTAAKIQSFTSWIHVSQLKTGLSPEEAALQPTQDSRDTSYDCELWDGLCFLFKKPSGLC